MPKFLEDALKDGAAKKGFSGKRAARYVFGAMNNMGAMRGNKETPKGAAMQAKHNRDTAKPMKKKAKAKGFVPMHKGVAKAMLKG